jgi:methylenetetrahydrofolate dehydrogenase (NADP+)/methenyltetrahydrofolate cyclohydrolase
MLLKAKPVVQQLQNETKQWLQENDKLDCYVAIFLLSDNIASEKYVSLKAAYAKELGIYADIMFGKDRELAEVLEEMTRCNEDEKCLGVMVQLPLADHLKAHQSTILEAIDPKKDIDGLTSAGFGTMSFGYTSLLGATPTSALQLLDAYDLGDMEGKTVLIISQSNLIGKRLAV